MFIDYTTGVDCEDICTDCITNDYHIQRQIAIDNDLCLIRVTWNRINFEGMVLEIVDEFGWEDSE